MNWNAGDLAKEWKRFKQHCQFTFDGPLSDKNEKAKVNYLMTYIGDKGREIYETFTWAPAANGQPAEKDTLEGVYTKFGNYVAPKKNEIRATVNFHNRKQGEHEKFDNFVTDLKILVKDCNYMDENRMVRDSIVLRSSHKAVKEKCLDKGDTLTLDMAIEIGQNYETAQESMKAINGEDAKVHALKFKSGQQRKKDKSRPQHKPPSQSKMRKCNRCGYDKHKKSDKCPAINEECGFCHKRNHFAIVCR